MDHPIDESAQYDYERQPCYVTVANGSEDNSLDFVVVNGHYRGTCSWRVCPNFVQEKLQPFTEALIMGRFAAAHDVLVLRLWS